VRELAIDFGTSNTVAALRVDGGAPRLLSVDGWPVLPSAVWLSPEGVLVVGRDAERPARLDPARFEPNPKRRVDEGEVLLGDTVVPVVDLVAAVLRRVLADAHPPLHRVVLTHPAGWGAVRTATLLEAVRRAGYAGPVELLPEPVAAAAHFAAGSPAPHGPIAVFDLGGGTTDTAVVAHTAAGWQVLADDGLADVGGADLDQLLLDHLGRQVGDTAEWRTLRRPVDAPARRAARALADDARAAKEALSRYPHADVPLPPPLPDVHVTRAELEELVRPSLERTAALCAATIERAGLVPGALAGLYLVGGGSRMPVVAQTLARRIGVLPVAVESPESSVALGALLAPTRHAATPSPPGPPAPVAAPVTRPISADPPTTPAEGWAAPRGKPVLRRAGRWPAVAGVVAAVAVVAVVVLAATQFAGDPSGRAGETSTVTSGAATSTATSSTAGVTATSDTGTDDPGGADPPDPVAASAPAKDEPFGEDAELRAFAGAAVDRAINCTYPGGTARATLGLRTQVQCVYRLGDQLWYASFFSSEDTRSCQQLAGTIALTGRDVTDGTWDGGGRSGTWKDATLSVPSTNNVTYYADSGGLLCGLVEGDEDNPMELSDIHDQWFVAVRPGS
jgi:hypothetical protein